jgi:transcriptional regulator with XRE-family HTH domain
LDVLQHILELRERRGWTEWRLAEESGLKQSTISTWYQKGQLPKIPSLERLCDAFGITLAHFFAGNDDAVNLTPEQRALLDNWGALSAKQKGIILALVQNMPSQND